MDVEYELLMSLEWWASMKASQAVVEIQKKSDMAVKLFMSSYEQLSGL